MRSLLVLLSLALVPSALAQTRRGDDRRPAERDSVVIETRNRRVVVEGAGDSARVVVRREGRERGDTLRLRMPDLDRVFRRVRVVDGDSTVALDSLLLRGGRRWRVRLDSLFGAERRSDDRRDRDGVRQLRLQGNTVEEEVTRSDDGTVTRRVIVRRPDGAEPGERSEMRVMVEGDELRINDGRETRTIRLPRDRAAVRERRADGTLVVPDGEGGTWIYVPPASRRD